MASNSGPFLGFSAAPISRRRFIWLWLSSYPLGNMPDQIFYQSFTWVDSRNPGLAKSAFAFAERDLIENKKYELCGHYIDAASSYGEITRLYKLTKKSLSSWPVPSARFSNKAATLVAWLAINDRKQDSDRIASKAGKELNEPDF